MDPTPKPKPEPERLEEFINLVNVYNPSEAILEGITGLRRLLSNPNTEAAEAANAIFLQQGVHRAFVGLMSPPADSPIMTESPEVRAKIVYECVFAYTNMTSFSTCEKFMELKDELFPVLMKCLGGKIEGAMNDENKKLKLDIATQTVWLLGNVAGDNAKFRDILIDAQFHVAILQSLQMAQNTVNAEFFRNVAWALTNFCRGKPEPDLEKLVPLVQALPMLFQMPDSEAILDLCWAVSYISDNTGKGGKQTGAHLIAQSGIINLLLQRAFSPSTMANLQKTAANNNNNNTENVNDDNLILIPVVRTIGSLISSEDNTLCTAVLQSGTLPMLVQLLSHPNPPKGLKKEIAWALSNVAAGTPEQAQLLVQSNAVPSLLATITSDPSPEVKKEALFAIANLVVNDAAAGDGAICQYLVNHNVIGVVAQVLPGLASDAKLCQLGLEIVDGLLQKGKERAEKQKEEKNAYVSMVQETELLETIEALQEHTSAAVFSLSHKIISEYFDPEDDDKEGLE